MPVTNPQVKDKEEAIIAKTMAVTLPKGKKKIKSASLADDDADWFKILLQGQTGSGKTFAIVGLLQTLNRDGKPTKVYVASTDIGGNGLRSVKAELRNLGLEHLLDNVQWVEFSTYEEFSAFTTSPENTVEINGGSFWAWDPDVIVWDGASNFQESLAWRYVMDLDPIAKESSESRDAGIQAGIVEYGQLRRITILQIDRFMMIHNPNGKKIHKLTTVLLDDGKESKLTKETKQGPLIIGGARDYMGPAFDIIITTLASQPPGSKIPTYLYRCEIGGKSVAKVRGQALPAEYMSKADMKGLWTYLTVPVASAIKAEASK